MSFTHLMKVSVLLLISLFTTNLLNAQVLASLNEAAPIEAATSEIDNNNWLSLSETVLYSSKTNQTTTLAYTLAKAEKITVDLSDTEGRILKKYTRNAKRNAGDYQQKIILPYGLPQGTYYLNVTSASGRVSVKVKHI